MRIDVLHPTTLLGKEIRDRLEAFPRLAGEVRLLSDQESEVGALTEVGGAAALVTRLEDDWRPADLVFFCGPLPHTRPVLARLGSGDTAVVLSLGATVADGEPVVAGVNLDSARPGRVLVSPNAGTVALARIVHALRAFSPRALSATVIQSVSQGDEDGLQELFEQGRSILTFAAQPPSPILGGQLAFNIVQAAESGDATVAQLAHLLGADMDVAVQLLTGGIFHGVSVSLNLRLAQDPGARELRSVLHKTSGIEVVRPAQRLGPVDAAQSENLLVGDVRPDPRHPGGYWLWATIDNLTTGGAVNALQVAESAFS